MDVPAGRRIARSLNGVVTNRWLWDGSLRPVAEVDSAGNLLTRYVYATHTNVPDYLVRNDSTYRLVTDERGSVRLVVNISTGAIVSSLSYDVWGNVTSSVSPSFQPFGFAGGLRDDATGLTHFGAREYAPELGRWTRKDPIGFNGGLTNLYGYVGNDPVNWVDEDGDAKIPIGMSGIVVKRFRNIASSLGVSCISGFSDQQIIDFLEFVPQDVAQQFWDSYDRRPDAGGKLTPSQIAANNREAKIERQILTTQLQRWKH